MPEKEADSPFLSRWARRKTEARELPPEAAPEKDLPAVAAPEELDPRSEEERREALIASLPDIETMEIGSDFKAFMQQGVPEQLKRLALRRLWKINPIFSHLDRMNDYDLDYTDAATVVANLQTVYQVGKGMPEPVKPLPLEAEVKPDSEIEDPEDPEQERVATEGPETAQGEAEPSETATGEAEAEGDSGVESADVSDQAVPGRVATGVGERLPPKSPFRSREDAEASQARCSASARSALQRRWGSQEG